MTASDAGYTPDPADVELAARAISLYDWDHQVSNNPEIGEHQRNEARAVLSALAATGRLVDPNAETRTEYGVRLTWDDGPVEDLESSNLAAAQGRVGMHARQRAERPGWRATAALIQRTHWVGPWLPAPTDTEESA